MALKEVMIFLETKFETQPINIQKFTELLKENPYLKRVFDQDLIIQTFSRFVFRANLMFNIIKEDKKNIYQEGHVATYIPSLGCVNPELW